MFRKYQEFSMKFFFDSGLSNAGSDLTVAAGLYILFVLAEVVGALACFIWICSDGFNHITIPWASLHIVFWSTVLLSLGFKNKYNFSQRKLPNSERKMQSFPPKSRFCKRNWIP